MRNAGLEEAQAGINTARRNISNFRYTDGTTLMTESGEKLKSLLMKMKEESEKAGLKLNIRGGGGKDGGGIGWQDHFLPHKFLKRTFQRRANFTKQLL